MQPSEAARERSGGVANVARLTVVRFLSLIAGFLASVLGARLLGTEGMGAVGVGVTVASLGAVVLSGGLGLSAIYFLNRRPHEHRAAVGQLLALGTVAIVLDVAVVAVVGVVTSATSPDLGLALLAAAPLSGAVLAFEIGGALLLGLAAERAYIVVQLAEAAVGLGATAIVLTLVSTSPGGFLAATSVGYGAGCALALLVVRRHVGTLRFDWSTTFTREVLAFGIRGQVGNIVQFLNLRLDLLLVSTFAGLPAAGLYYVAVRVSEAVLVVAQAGATLLYPRVAAQEDRRATEATAALVRVTLLVVGAGAAALVLVGEPLILVVFGAAFGEAVWAARIVAIAMLPFAIQRLLAGDVRGRGRPGLASTSSAIALVATIALDVVLIPRFGIVGAAVASLVAYAVGAAALVAFFSRTTGTSARALIPRWSDVVMLGRARSVAVEALGLRRFVGGNDQHGSGQ